MPATSHCAQMAAKNLVTSLLSGTSLLSDLEADDLERAGAVGQRLDRVFCDLGKLAAIARRLVDA
jgi:hypothetical protein